MLFAAGFRRSLNEAYEEAKSRFGIITSLPFSTEAVEQSDADRLRFYLKNKRNRERLREIGFGGAWFAILEGIIIGSGPTKDAVEEILQKTVPTEKSEFVHIFHLGGK